MAKILIDPVVGLSLSLVANRGVYALLIGSGVSRAARIQTGWEITLDLIRKLGVAQGVDCASDPASWYRTTFNEEPDYSDLLNQLGKSPEERNQLLKSYFEPTDEEREQGWKQPTKAHHAIAKLVADGYIKIILTTNFDRLLERAIEEAGVTPTVISTTDAVAGSLPLSHQRCCVAKLHGDYLDMRIKNTVDELAKYDRSVNRLLDRVFDEFGLIVCGWSGVWDKALRAAIERCKSRRFSTFWTCVSEPEKEAMQLIERRGGQIIRIKGADAFFQELSDKAAALEASAAPHPLTTVAAVATLKKFIAEDRYNVRLRDLIFDEAEHVHRDISAKNREILGRSLRDSDIPGVYQQYREINTTLIELLVHGCHWSRPNTDGFFTAALQQVCRQPAPMSGPILNNGFLHYPVALLLYAAGLTATGAGKVNLLAALFSRPQLRDVGQVAPLVSGIDWPKVAEFCKTLFPNEKKWVPLSEHMFHVLREPLRTYFPDDGEFENIFDRFEYMRAIVVADLRNKKDGASWWWGPMGRFAWKARHRWNERTVLTEISEEIKSMGPEWPALKAGLFDGSVDRLNIVMTGVNEAIAKLEWY